MARPRVLSVFPGACGSSRGAGKFPELTGDSIARLFALLPPED